MLARFTRSSHHLLDDCAHPGLLFGISAILPDATGVIAKQRKTRQHRHGEPCRIERHLLGTGVALEPKAREGHGDRRDCH
jgi:hypothetical protein